MSILSIRRRTAAQWTDQNPSLSRDVMGIETDTGKFKFGTGGTAWADLAYGSAGGGGVESQSVLVAGVGTMVFTNGLLTSFTAA